MKNNKIVFIHQFNNFTGSPLVLSHIIKVAEKNFGAIDLITNQGEGFLTNSNCNIEIIPYNRSNYKILTLLSFIVYQLKLFLKLLKYRDQNVIFYVNTIMPFSAGLAGKILGKKVVFHHHEASINRFIKFIAKTIISISSFKNIFVSNYLYQKEKIKSVKSEIVYNTLAKDFARKALQTPFEIKDNIYILMICSLRKYKGVDQFIKISNLCLDYPSIRFELVVDANTKEINSFFNNTEIPPNLEIYSGRSTKVSEHYKKANILLSLSDKNRWVETFGMTILEAMAYGVPSIVPEVGGPLEIIEDGINGFHIDSYNLNKISSTIIRLHKNSNELNQLSVAARHKFDEFDFSFFEKKMNEIFKDLKN